MGDVNTAIIRGTLSDDGAIAELRRRRELFASDLGLSPVFRVHGLRAFDSALRPNRLLPNGEDEPTILMLRRVLKEIGKLYIENDRRKMSLSVPVEDEEINEDAYTDYKDSGNESACGKTASASSSAVADKARIEAAAAWRSKWRRRRKQKTRARRETSSNSSRPIQQETSDDSEGRNSIMPHSSQVAQHVDMMPTTCTGHELVFLPTRIRMPASTVPTDNGNCNAEMENDPHPSGIPAGPILPAANPNASLIVKLRVPGLGQLLREQLNGVFIQTLVPAAPTEKRKQASPDVVSKVETGTTPKSKRKPRSTTIAPTNDNENASSNQTPLRSDKRKRRNARISWLASEDRPVERPRKRRMTRVFKSAEVVTSDMENEEDDDDDEMNNGGNDTKNSTDDTFPHSSNEVTTTQHVPKPSSSSSSSSSSSPPSPTSFSTLTRISFPPIPALPPRAVEPFYRGARIALTNILDDHSASPESTLLELIQDLEANAPTMVAWEGVTVLEGGQWVYGVLKELYHDVPSLSSVQDADSGVSKYTGKYTGKDKGEGIGKGKGKGRAKAREEIDVEAVVEQMQQWVDAEFAMLQGGGTKGLSKQEELGVAA